MSKMDELRAFREARYEQAMARAAAHRARTPAQAERPVAKPAAEPAEVEPPAVELPEADPEVRLCGHRAISGRTCTREHGHAAKSHRYS